MKKTILLQERLLGLIGLHLIILTHYTYMTATQSLKNSLFLANPDQLHIQSHQTEIIGFKFVSKKLEQACGQIVDILNILLDIRQSRATSI